MYADDGILFPKSEEEISKLSDSKAGVNVNPSKSG